MNHMTQIVLLAGVGGFLVGLVVMALFAFNAHEAMAARATDAEEKLEDWKRAVIKLNEEAVARFASNQELARKALDLHDTLKDCEEKRARLEAELRESQQATADSMRKANELAKQVREMSTR